MFQEKDCKVELSTCLWDHGLLPVDDLITDRDATSRNIYAAPMARNLIKRANIHTCQQVNLMSHDEPFQSADVVVTRPISRASQHWSLTFLWPRQAAVGSATDCCTELHVIYCKSPGKISANYVQHIFITLRYDAGQVTGLAIRHQC